MSSAPNILLTDESGELAQSVVLIAHARRLLIVAEQLGLNVPSLRSSLEQLVAAVSLGATAPQRQLPLFGIARTRATALSRASTHASHSNPPTSQR